MKLSVVVTAYGRPEGLGQTLESLAVQTRMPDELYVYDDASPDNSPEVAKRFEGRFPKYRYVRNERNLGMPENLNRAISRTTGDIVVNLHDADVYHPTLLEKCEAILVKYPSAGLAFWDSVGKMGRHNHIPEFLQGRAFFERYFLFQRKSFIWGTVAARREVYERLLPFEEAFGAWADVDMWMRVCRMYDIVHIREALVDLENGGAFREFNFEKVLRVQKMIFINIHRFYRNEPRRLRSAIKGQEWVQRYRWCYHMAAGAARFDFYRLAEGLRKIPRFLVAPRFEQSQIDSDFQKKVLPGCGKNA